MATSVFLAVALTAAGDELVITRGGRRVIDPDPSTAATNCSGWSYDPAPVAFEDSISNVYSTSGILRNPCGDAVPFGDQIWWHVRGANDVFTAQPVLGRTSFRWMFGDTPIDPQTYIGRLASPSVVHIGGRYFMAFVASVSDPALCGGEHTGQVCGLCKDAFSYYVMYWAMSDDGGATWHVFNRDNLAANVALSNALLYRSPNANDQLPGTQYRGVSRVRILLADTYVWFLTQFSTGSGVRTIMLRAPFDASTQWGIAGPLEAWRNDQGTWQAVTNSVLPDEFNDPDIHSDLFPAVVSISDTSHFQSDRFIGLIPNGSHVDYVLSNDLLELDAGEAVAQLDPYFADDRGYAGSVVDPTLVEDATGTLHLFMASSDGDSDHGIVRDGVRDCAPPPSYLGLGIYEGIVQLAPLASTTVTVTPRANPAATGVVAFDVRVTANDGTSPNGRLTLTIGSFSSTVDVNSGRATVFAPLNTAGTYPVHASFTSFGPWNPSNADTQITVVLGSPPKKRAVRH